MRYYTTINGELKVEYPSAIQKARDEQERREAELAAFFGLSAEIDPEEEARRFQASIDSLLDCVPDDEEPLISNEDLVEAPPTADRTHRLDEDIALSHDILALLDIEDDDETVPPFSSQTGNQPGGLNGHDRHSASTGLVTNYNTPNTSTPALSPIAQFIRDQRKAEPRGLPTHLYHITYETKDEPDLWVRRKKPLRQTVHPSCVDPTSYRSSCGDASIEKAQKGVDWSRLTVDDKAPLFFQQAAYENAIAFSLNFSPQKESALLQAAKAGADPARNLSRSINRAAKKHFSKTLPMVFAFEFTKEGRLHVHGCVVLPIDGELAAALFRKVLKSSGGKVSGYGAGRQIDLKPMHDSAGWHGYCRKDVDRTRQMLGTDKILFVSQDLRRRTEDAYRGRSKSVAAEESADCANDISLEEFLASLDEPGLEPTDPGSCADGNHLAATKQSLPVIANVVLPLALSFACLENACFPADTGEAIGGRKRYGLETHKPQSALRQGIGPPIEKKRLYVIFLRLLSTRALPTRPQASIERSSGLCHAIACQVPIFSCA